MTQAITQAYLQDLGLEFSGQSLAFLNELQCNHIARYTFNNLAVILGQELPLDTEALFEKIVQQGRGGYCFEHNKLSFEVLQHLGFDVRILMARVLYNQENDVPRTHRITLLNLEGQNYIVDTGFGHYGSRQPLELTPGKVQEVGDEVFRIQDNGNGEYNFQIVKDGDFFTLYRFDLQRYTEADCLVSHFFSHRYPQAGFVNNMVVCSKQPDKVISLRNHELHIMRAGNTEITPVEDADQLHSLLNDLLDLETEQAVAEHLFARFVLPKQQAI